MIRLYESSETTFDHHKSVLTNVLSCVVEEVIDVTPIPTLEERVATVETKTVTLEETLEVLFG